MVFSLQFIKYIEYWSWACVTLTNKVSKRPNNVDLAKLSLSRSLFAIKFTKLLEEDMIIANVDEWLVNYKSGDGYSWWKRGTSVELKSLPFKGSISIIFWIFSNGAYFWSIIQRTVNSSIFCQYLKMVSDWISRKVIFESKRIILILDNWSSHRAKSTKQVMNASKLNYLFLPSYSPQLAPVELSFNSFKGRLSKQWRGTVTDLNDIGAFEKIGISVNLFTKEEIRRYFVIFFEQLKFNFCNSIV